MENTSEEVGRITPEMVKAARVALPQFGVARDQFACVREGRECLCGMSLVAVHRSKASVRELYQIGLDLNAIAIRLGVTYGYARSFMYGFDGKEKPWQFDQQGYSDGMECAAALGLTSPQQRFAD